MKRTTMVLEDEIFRRIKQEAARSGETLKDYLNDLLKGALTRKKSGPFKLHWKTVKGTARPTVPIEDRDRLYDWLDSHHS